MIFFIYNKTYFRSSSAICIIRKQHTPAKRARREHVVGAGSHIIERPAMMAKNNIAIMIIVVFIFLLFYKLVVILSFMY